MPRRAENIRLTLNDQRLLQNMARAQRNPQGLTPTRRGDGASRMLFAWFSVVTEQNDYLDCNRVQGDGTIDTSATIRVAKPWDLRQTPFHGLTVNGITYTYVAGGRSATDGTFTETQAIVPAYFVGALIVGIGGGLGGAQLTVSSRPVPWLDMNLAARAWQKDD